MTAILEEGQALPALRLRVLEALSEEQWETVADLLPRYLTATAQLIQAWQQAAIPDEKAAIAALLQEALKDQAAIAGRLRSRMAWLEERMVKLQQGKSGCQLYAAQLPGDLA